MTLAPLPVREGTPRAAPPGEAPPMTPSPAPAPAAAPARPGPLPAEDLVALAVAEGAEDPDVAAGRVFAAADGSRHRLSAARSLLIQRLKVRSGDLEATLALRILERALVRAPYPDGPWRWAENLSPRRLRAADRRRRRTVRRGRTARRRPDRPAWRSAWRRAG